MTEGTQPAGGAIRVGDFVVDPRSGELRGAAGRQLLSAQPLHVLLALAERPGAVVTRDELRARLWPADTYVDFEHGLNAIVKRLRDALGDSADTPRYIETVPRRGYRLVALVEPADPAPASSASQVSSPPTVEVRVARPVVDPPSAIPAPQPPPGRRRARLAAAAVLAAGSLVAFVYVGRWRQGQAPSGRSVVPASEPVRLTFGAGIQTDPTWSPDGRRIAFAWDRDGNFDIFAQSIDGGEPTRITSSAANETQPAWSPDGTRLVFLSEGDDSGLYTVGINGGAVRRIAGNGFHAAWTPDGRDILFSSATEERLYLVRSDGGEPPREILTGQLAGGNWGSFAMHPDGRLGIFGVHPAMGFGFFVSDRAYRKLQRVVTEKQIPLETPPRLSRVSWSRAGDAVFIETVTAGVAGIWRAPVDPTTLTWGPRVRLTTGLAGAGGAAISPDGTTLAFMNSQSVKRAWVFPFDADRGSPPGEGRAVTDEEATVSWAWLSADGSAIFYSEERPGQKTVRGVRTNLATGKTSVLVDSVHGSMIPSATGDRVAYTLDRPAEGEPRGGGQHYAVVWRDRGGRERLISTWSPAAVLPTDWRRDNRALLATFLQRSHTGPGALVEWPVDSSDAAAPSRILLESPSKQFWQGRYSPDGRWISFVVNNLERDGPLEAGITPATGATTTWTRIASDHAWPDKLRWAPDGRTLYFLSKAPSGFFNVWGVRVDPERGAQVGAPFQVTRFDSPRRHIDPSNSTCELGIARGVLTLPMRTVKGSIWLLAMAGR